MNTADRLAERHKADVYAITAHPAVVKPPRRVRVSGFIEGYLTTGWVIRTGATLLGFNRKD